MSSCGLELDRSQDSFNLGWAARSPFFRGLKFKVPETPTWYFTDDLSNLALAVRGLAEVVIVLDECGVIFYCLDLIL